MPLSDAPVSGSSSPGGATVRDASRAVLRACGMTTVFGNPGSTEMPFFRDWPDDLDYVLGLQEATVVAMADGHAQATGNAAFVNLHSAAGLGNALGSIYTAYRNRSPLLVMAGQQHRALFPGEPFLFAESADAFPRPYVKWSVEPARAADVPRALLRGYHLAMQAPRGPVFVSVPMDDWDAAAEVPPARAVRGAPRATEAALVELARALDAARAPVLVVGPGVDRAGGFAAAVALAERLGLPVWASPRSPRASFPEDHPAFQGFLPFDRRGLRTALKHHDLVVVAGAPVFTYHVHAEGADLPQGASLVHLTDDPDEAARALVGTSVLGDVAAALERLAELTDQAERQPPLRARPEPPLPSEPLGAEYVLHRLAVELPDGAAVVEETPSHRNALHDHLPIRWAEGFYTTSSGGLGWAMPAAVGIQLARPDRRVVCLVGDGSSLYSPQALWTAAQRGAPVVFVILNNGGYGAMKGFADMTGVATGPSYDLPGLDLAGLARSLGCSAEEIRTPRQLDDALSRALASDRPSLLDVRVDPGRGTFA